MVASHKMVGVQSQPVRRRPCRDTPLNCTLLEPGEGPPKPLPNGKRCPRKVYVGKWVFRYVYRWVLPVPSRIRNQTGHDYHPYVIIVNVVTVIVNVCGAGVYGTEARVLSCVPPSQPRNRYVSCCPSAPKGLVLAITTHIVKGPLRAASPNVSGLPPSYAIYPCVPSAARSEPTSLHAYRTLLNRLCA